jgi:hypothetical protein
MHLEDTMRWERRAPWIQNTYNTLGVQRRHAGDRASLHPLSKVIHIATVALKWENYGVGWESSEAGV